MATNGDLPGEVRIQVADINCHFVFIVITASKTQLKSSVLKCFQEREQKLVMQSSTKFPSRVLLEYQKTESSRIEYFLQKLKSSSSILGPSSSFDSSNEYVKIKGVLVAFLNENVG